MCGRYATTRGVADLSALFDGIDDIGTLSPDYNVAPTDPVPIVRMSERLGGRALSLARWGLVPAWARDPRQGARMINARAETVARSSAFGPSFARRRCLVPADGWYEWVKLGVKGRRAYYMTPADGGVLAFAGLWTTWGEGDGRLLTCSIVTTAALGELASVHDRMPLALPRSRWAEWLIGPADPASLLAPPPADLLAGIEIRPVGPAVGDVRNDGPALIERIDAGPLTPPDEPVDLTLF
ncbi:MAG TPA: SOS response-associated peptidase [Micromonosporaceae bacterium]|jgi:putative SOS response-associated peptidase YedK